ALFILDTAATVLSPLSLHDALPIWRPLPPAPVGRGQPAGAGHRGRGLPQGAHVVADAAEGDHEGLLHDLRKLSAGRPRRLAEPRSEEHTSELQSRENLVCRLLLEKK